MRKGVIRLQAFMLAVILTLSCVLLPDSGVFASDVLFSDDFASSISTKWHNQSTGSVTDSQYVLKAGESNYVTDSVNTKNTIVSSDVTLNIVKKETNVGYASVVLRTDPGMNTGYGMAIGVSKSGGTYARLYRMGGDEDAEILKQMTDDIPGVGKLKKTKTYTLTLAIHENRIIGLINGTIFADVTDTACATGYSGVKTDGIGAKFDNVVMKETPEMKAEKMELLSHSEKVAPYEKINFEIDVTYNSIYGKTTINQDTEGVTVSGYDGKPGSKKVTVSYMGGETSFYVLITPAYEKQELWLDNFESGALNDKYTGGSYTNKDYNFTYAFKQQNGTAGIDVPNLNGGDVYGEATLYLSEAKTDEWGSYSISTKATIYEDWPTRTVRLGYTGIVFGKAQNSDLVFRVASDGSFYIRKGQVNLRTSSLGIYDINIEKGKEISMQVKLYGDWAEFYVNDKKVCSYWFDKELEPCMGLVAGNGKIKFNSVSVTSQQEYSKFCINNLSVVGTDDGVVTHIKAKSLFSNPLLLKTKYPNGFTDYQSITKKMVKGYNESSRSAKPQTITVAYGPLEASFLYSYSKYLYYDDFVGNDLSSRWSLTGTQNYSVADSNLKFAYQHTAEDGQTRHSKNFYGVITKGDAWTNYSISTDVSIHSMYYAKSQSIALRARINGSSFYQLSFGYSSAGALSMNMARVKGIHSFSYGSLTDAELEEILRDEAGNPKKDVKLKLSVSGNLIQGYLDNKLMFSFYDESQDALSYGPAGFYAENLNGYADNFIVEEQDVKIISGLGIANNSNDTFQIYEGGYIEMWKQEMEVTYTDGSIDIMPITYDMLSEFDNTALGKQRVTLTYEGFTDTIYVEVLERPEYIAEVGEQLEAFKSSITASDVEAFYELKAVYNTLSGYEAEQLPEKLKKKYEKLCVQVEEMLYPQIKDEPLLMDGSLDAESAKDWDSLELWRVGKWIDVGDKWYHGQREYDRWGDNVLVSNKYADAKMVSADIMLLYEEMVAGVAMNACEYGYYALWVNGKAKDEEGNRIYQIELTKYNGASTRVLASNVLLDCGIELHKDQWFNLALIEEDGKLTGYMNGQQILVYDNLSGGYFAEGQFGVHVEQGNALVDNIRVYGVEVAAPDEIVNVKPTNYKDDFEDEKAGTSPSHWIETSDWEEVLERWKIHSINGSKMYGTTYTEGYTASWLHVFEENPDMTLKFSVGDKPSQGSFGFITRMAPETAFVKIGYNFSNSKWYICDQQSKNGGSSFYYADETFSLKTGRVYTAHIVEDGQKVSLYIDEKLVVETDKVTQIAVGRVGVFADGTALYIDDVDIIFAGGDVPQDGITTYELEPEANNSLLELQSLDENTIVGIGNKRRYISTDKGLTWTAITSEPEWDDLWITGTYQSLLKRHDGKYLQLITQVSNIGKMEEEAFTIMESSDLKNWKTIGKVLSEDEKKLLGSGVGQNWPLAHINGMVEFQLEDGTWRIFLPVSYSDEKNAGCIYTQIFYSDDGGVTWKSSEDTTQDICEEGESVVTKWEESKLVQCSDGTLRLYCPRTYFGCMQYTESTDGGVTWSGLYQIPEIQQSMASFAVCEDPEEPGTWYMIWVNCQGFFVGSIEYRNRLCMARSYDGKNWEFLMNCEWMSDYISPNGNSLYQLVDSTIFIEGDYIYVTGGRSTEEYSMKTASSHQYQRLNYLRIEKDKLQARAWDSSTISNMNFVKEVSYENMPQTKFGQGDIFAISKDVTVKTTSLACKEKMEQFQKNCIVYSSPNMNKMGKQTVVVRYRNGMDLSYEIEIVPSYRIKWNVSEGGTVVNQLKKLLEGATQTFELKPDAGYKVDYVLVNEEEVEVKDNTFTVENVNKVLEIEVVFAQKTILDYWPIILGVILVLGGAGGGFWYYKKKKKVGEKNEVGK